jgi:hypothetical protein
MPNKQIEQGQPKVGIFWLFNGQLIFDTSLLSDGEDDGEFIDHPTGHTDYWEELQRLGVVPRDVDYEEPPRGRVLFKKKSGRFALYADRCILKKESAVKQIMNAMRLPARQTDVGTDGHFGHYKCFTCLKATHARDEGMII